MTLLDPQRGLSRVPGARAPVGRRTEDGGGGGWRRVVNRDPGGVFLGRGGRVVRDHRVAAARRVVTTTKTKERALPRGVFGVSWC